MGHLLASAGDDLEQQKLTRATEKAGWIRDFSRTVTRLSAAARNLSLQRAARGKDVNEKWSPSESTAFGEFFAGLQKFDAALLHHVTRGGRTAEETIATGSLLNPSYALLHLARISNLSCQAWETNLLETGLPTGPGNQDFRLDADVLAQAVKGDHLLGDTAFEPFRTLHQIPELLAGEINHLVEAGITALNSGKPMKGLMFLSRINMLGRPLAACLPPLIDNLTTGRYHEFRENLGQGSGMQSKQIRELLFMDGYPRLFTAIKTATADCGERKGAQLRDEYEQLHDLLRSWRQDHVNLPMNNMGAGGVVSLGGAKDGPNTSDKLQATAARRDLYLLDAEETLTRPSFDGAILRPYMRDPESCAAALLLATGNLTMTTFSDVQSNGRGLPPETHSLAQ
jgi:hypothetical protein